MTQDHAQPDTVTHLADKMGGAFGRFRQDLQARMGNSGPLRVSHLRVLDSIDVDGTRPSTLADRTEITRQGISQLLAHLEQHGYVVSARDPSDRRASLITPTASGVEVQQRTVAAVAAVEDLWRQRLGQDRYEAFVGCLDQLSARDQ